SALEIIDSKLRWVLDSYLRIFSFIESQNRRFKVVKNEDLVLSTDEQFKEIKETLGSDLELSLSKNFSAFPAHIIGGNRAPLWLQTGKVAKKGQERYNYYAQAKGKSSDFIFDEKYK